MSEDSIPRAGPVYQSFQDLLAGIRQRRKDDPTPRQMDWEDCGWCGCHHSVSRRHEGKAVCVLCYHSGAHLRGKE